MTPPGFTLPGDLEMREPTRAELDFFRTRPDVAGMATEDGKVILNPFSALTPQQYECVAINEAARVLMMSREGMRPTFDITEEQWREFHAYGPLDAIRETIAARLLSDDPSALSPTVEQLAFVERLRGAMKLKS